MLCAVLLVSVKGDLFIALFNIATGCTALSGWVQLVCQNKPLAVPTAFVGQDLLELAKH